jgi:hypothetical protein
MGFLRPKFLRKHGLTHFTRYVETGTANGSGIERLRKMFPVLFTVELSEQMAREAGERLRNYANIHRFVGDSPTFLKHIIDPKKSTLFFLDAHYTHTHPRNVKAAALRQCPVLDELHTIFGFTWQAEFAILVDDVHLFQRWYRVRRMPKKGYRLDEWPKLDQLEKVAAKHRCDTLVDDNMLLIRRA